MYKPVPLFFNKQKLVMAVYKYILVMAIGLSTIVCGQSNFSFPLKEKVFLTGNYAEIRPSHFHAGLDFRTHPVNNIPIYAVAAGYVSRIKVGTHGYGKVLYITHANGLVSVYGHQYAFNETIKKYVEAAQMKQETFEIELLPKPNELPIKQEGVIGYSGNTGDVEGPHLHFEIRDEKTEAPLNPLRFFKILDTVAPKINIVAFYEDDYVLQGLVKINFPAGRAGKKQDTISVSTKFGIGIECFDLETAKGNKNNIYITELYLDGKLFYEHTLDSIHFDLARYVNTFCDYAIKKKTGIKIQKCFVGKNNDLSIYKTGAEKGFIYLNDTLFHELNIKVYDFFKQRDEIKIIVKRKPADRMKPIINPSVNCLKPYKNATADYSIEIPEKSFYKDVTLVDSFNNSILHLYADKYEVPFHKSCTLSIKAPAQLLKYGDKLCIAEVSGNEKKYSGGNLENGFVKTTIKNFGKYKVSLDTAAPKIKFLPSRQAGIQPKKKKQNKSGDVIYFKVGDDFSGIGNFKVFVNDKFQLSEYEHKTGMIYFQLNENTPKGKIKVKLILGDKKNNRSTFETELFITKP